MRIQLLSNQLQTNGELRGIVLSPAKEKVPLKPKTFVRLIFSWMGYQGLSYLAQTLEIPQVYSADVPDVRVRDVQRYRLLREEF